MSSSKRETTELSTSLENDPQGNWNAWAEELADLARSKCAAYSPLGAIHMGCTDALWNSLPENLPPNVQPNTVVARPVYDRPPPLDPTASPTERLIFTDQKEIFQAHAVASAELRNAVINSIGKSNKLLIEHPIHGMNAHTAQTILDALLPIYGKYTEAFITALESDLERKLPRITEFESHVGKFRKALNMLGLAGQPLLPLKQYTTFIKTLSPFSPFSTHINNYVDSHAALTTRTFPSLAAHLRLHLPTITAAAAGNAFAGGVAPSPSPPPCFPSNEARNR